MVLVIVVEPQGKDLEYLLGILEIREMNIVPFEGFHKCFGHSVALRTSHRGGTDDQTHDLGELPGLLGGVAGAVIGEHSIGWGS